MATIPSHILSEAKSRDFRPSVRIGKSGLSETVIDEIRQQLGSRSLVKIKVNKGLFERELFGRGARDLVRRSYVSNAIFLNAVREVAGLVVSHYFYSSSQSSSMVESSIRRV